MGGMGGWVGVREKEEGWRERGSGAWPRSTQPLYWVTARNWWPARSRCCYCRRLCSGLRPPRHASFTGPRHSTPPPPLPMPFASLLHPPHKKMKTVRGYSCLLRSRSEAKRENMGREGRRTSSKNKLLSELQREWEANSSMAAIMRRCHH